MTREISKIIILADKSNWRFIGILETIQVQSSIDTYNL